MDAARQQQVGGDTGACYFRRERLVPADQRRAQRVGKRQIGDRLEHSGRGNRQHAPPAARLHLRHDEIGERDDADDHRLEISIEVFRRQHLFRRSRDGATGVVDEDVHAAEQSLCFAGNKGREAAIGNVRRHILRFALAFRIDRRAIGRQLVCAAPAQKNIHTLARQSHSDAQAKAARRGEHEGALAGNTQIHEVSPLFTLTYSLIDSIRKAGIGSFRNAIRSDFFLPFN